MYMLMYMCMLPCMYVCTVWVEPYNSSPPVQCICRCRWTTHNALRHTHSRLAGNPVKPTSADPEGKPTGTQQVATHSNQIRTRAARSKVRHHTRLDTCQINS